MIPQPGRVDSQWNPTDEIAQCNVYRKKEDLTRRACCIMPQQERGLICNAVAAVRIFLVVETTVKNLSDAGAQWGGAIWQKPGRPRPVAGRHVPGKLFRTGMEILVQTSEISTLSQSLCLSGCMKKKWPSDSVGTMCGVGFTLSVFHCLLQ
jgi:hypothetical protein